MLHVYSWLQPTLLTRECNTAGQSRGSVTQCTGEGYWPCDGDRDGDLLSAAHYNSFRYRFPSQPPSPLPAARRQCLVSRQNLPIVTRKLLSLVRLFELASFYCVSTYHRHARQWQGHWLIVCITEKLIQNIHQCSGKAKMSHYFFPGKLQAGQRQERLCKNKDPISTESIFTLCRKVDEDVLL